MADAAAALGRIAAAQAPFLSRGDDSGTHRRERALWAAAGLDPTGASGTWYREAGQGMGATLNTAAMMEAYTLTDRGTWLKMRARLDLRLLVEGDARLRNQYGVTLVSRERHAHVKARPARRFRGMADLAGRPGGDRPLHHRRRASLHPQRDPRRALDTARTIRVSAGQAGLTRP